MAETFISAAVIKGEMLNPLILVLLWFYEQERVLDAEGSSSSHKMAARRAYATATP